MLRNLREGEKVLAARLGAVERVPPGLGGLALAAGAGAAQRGVHLRVHADCVQVLGAEDRLTADFLLRLFFYRLHAFVVALVASEKAVISVAVFEDLAEILHHFALAVVASVRYNTVPVVAGEEGFREAVHRQFLLLFKASRLFATPSE